MYMCIDAIKGLDSEMKLGGSIGSEGEAETNQQQQMKSQYQFDIVFIRLAAKTDVFTNFRILLVIDLTKNTPALKNKYYHALKLEREQKILNLKQLEPFRLLIQEDDANSDSYSLEIKDDLTGQVIEIIPLPTSRTLRNFQVDGKTVNDQRHQGNYMNLNFKINIEKPAPQPPNLSPNNSKQEGQQMRQTLSRTRRPPMLASVKTKMSQLKESQRIREEALKEDDVQAEKTQESKPLFQGLADKPVPVHEIKLNLVEREKDPTMWEPLSAIPEQLSAWLRRKVKPMESQVQQVKELLQSHHPDQQEVPTSKLSIKLKIVIVMLIMGFFILIADMLKKQTYKLIYGKYPKPAKGKSPSKASKEAHKSQKRTNSKPKREVRSKAKKHA